MPTHSANRAVRGRRVFGWKEPSADAEPAELIRRVYYDLNGLPPTRKEVDTFVSDPSRQAFESIVDDLLSRRAFGEKWGRHWLDVANGGDRNFTFF